MKKQVIIDFENSVNIKVQKANHMAQFFQTLCILCLTLVVGGFVLLENGRWFVVWTIICVTFAAASFVFAIYLGLKAVKIYSTTRFAVSDQRLATLIATEMPVDVVRAMERFERGKYKGEGRFFYLVASRVGTERCAELRDKIFKYTKVD